MSDITTHLLLPYILAAQAQKHATHTEAVRLLDAIVQLSVLDRDLSAPPASPADGDTSAAAYARGHVLMARLGGPPAPAYAGVPCVFEDGAPTAAVGSAFTDGDGTTLGIFVPPPPDSVAGTVRVRLNDEGRRRFAAAGAGRPFSIGYDVADEPKGRPTIRAVTRYAGPTCGPIPCHRCGRPLFGMNCATCNPVPDDEPEGRP
jgi:hypothetical protein